jgi:hypothetical protein
MVLLIACGFILSCSTRSVRREFSGSRELYVGWLDLGAGDFRKYGYPAREEWERDIADVNRGLQKFVRDYMKGFAVTGASKVRERPPAYGYAIYFSNAAIDPQTSIVADISIRDMGTGKVVTKFSAYGTSFHMSYSMYSFAGKLNNACYALAYEIYTQMTESGNGEPSRDAGSGGYAETVDQPVIKATGERATKRKEVRPGVFVWE